VFQHEHHAPVGQKRVALARAPAQTAQHNTAAPPPHNLCGGWNVHHHGAKTAHNFREWGSHVLRRDPGLKAEVSARKERR
jgi:hypothetical protein